MQLLTGKRNRVRRSKAVSKDNEQGFTLIETMIALIVMMVAGLAAASLFIYAINYNSGAYDRTLALAVAQQRMEHLRKGSFNEVVSSNSSNVQSANRSFNVVTTVTGTSLKSITITVTPQGAGSGWAGRPVIIISQRAALGTGTYF